MLFTTHALTGAVIGSATGNFGASFIIALVLHHFLDWIPHYDPSSFKTINSTSQQLKIQTWFMGILDLIIGLGFISLIWFTTKQPVSMFGGVLGGVLPDMIDVVPGISDRFQRTKFGRIYHNFHIKIHSTTSYNKSGFGVGIQLIMVIISLWYLLTKI